MDFERTVVQPVGAAALAEPCRRNLRRGRLVLVPADGGRERLERHGGTVRVDDGDPVVIGDEGHLVEADLPRLRNGLVILERVVTDVEFIAHGDERMVPGRVGISVQPVGRDDRTALLGRDLVEGTHRRGADRLPHLIRRFIVGVDGERQVVKPFVIEHERPLVDGALVHDLRPADLAGACEGDAGNALVVWLPPFFHLHDIGGAGGVPRALIVREEQINITVYVHKRLGVDGGKIAVRPGGAFPVRFIERMIFRHLREVDERLRNAAPFGEGSHRRSRGGERDVMRLVFRDALRRRAVIHIVHAVLGIIVNGGRPEIHVRPERVEVGAEHGAEILPVGHIPRAPCVDGGGRRDIRVIVPGVLLHLPVLIERFRHPDERRVGALHGLYVAVEKRGIELLDVLAVGDVCELVAAGAPGKSERQEHTEEDGQCQQFPFHLFPPHAFSVMCVMTVGFRLLSAPTTRSAPAPSFSPASR